MGGKGRRRREKNFVASHGGDKRLPPAPKSKEIDALPSKLRRLMQFKNASSNNPGKTKVKTLKDSKFEKGAINIKSNLNKQKDKDKETNKNSDSEEEKKKKKKRKAPMDLRFGNLDEVASNTRKKKRKEYLDAKKKKHKKDNNNNNNKDDEIRNFPGREEIKFGEIVQAPPKLSFPKVSKNIMDASKERLRIKAIEEYRNRKKWDSRPGIQLPNPETL